MKLTSWQAVQCASENAREVKIRSVQNFFCHLRVLCHEKLITAPPMGGRGLPAVQIDETLMRGRRKAHVGRMLLGNRINGLRGRNFGRAIRGPWVFGLVTRDRRHKLDLRMFVVRRRDVETLRPIVRRHVMPGANIHSDEWRAYLRLAAWARPRYRHSTVNHQAHFVNPQNGAHTQRIEACWGHVKTRILRAEHGSKGNIQLHLSENWFWRKNEGDIYPATQQMIRDLRPAIQL